MTEIAIVDPRTGELLEDLEHQPSDLLAAVALTLRERQGALRKMSGAVEGELTARLQREGRRVATVGDYEISFKARNESRWDPDDTEAALAELVDQGAITASEAVGIIEEKREVKRREAKALLDRLHGPAREILQACCEWTQGSPRFSVVESVQLVEPTREP